MARFERAILPTLRLMSLPPEIANSNEKERRLHLGWREVALALLIAFLAYQVVIPFLMIVWARLNTARRGEPEFLSLVITLANYARAFGSASFWSTSGNTLGF